MKWTLVAALLSATSAQALPVRIEMGEAVFVCDASVFSSDFIGTAEDDRININAAPINGRPDAFVRLGCP